MLQILLFSFPFQLTPSRRATKSGSVLVLQWEFQLTPSRRATSGFFSVALIVFNFNSRPHGGRRGRSEMPYDNAAFQLTPSRRATREHFCFPCRTAFQLTPSRRATGRNAESGGSCNNFNSRPHGGRPMHRPSCQSHRNFNSRPHGGRLDGTSERGLNRRFQLTPSRRATRCTVHLVNLIEISTHALTEGDGASLSWITEAWYFNSRPHGGRQHGTVWMYGGRAISTHALTEGDL